MLWSRCCRLRQHDSRYERHLLPAKVKLSFWMTIRVAWRPYRRVYSYVKPYKFRFALALGFGFLFGAINSSLPLVLARVMNFVFQGKAMDPQALMKDTSALNQGPQINSILILCLAIPAVMTARSFCSYLSAYYTAWVSSKVLTDIRDELFGKILRNSMDFFNKMHSGMLMSRVTQRHPADAGRALHREQRHVFKQPVSLASAASRFLLLHGLEVHPGDAGPLSELPDSAEPFTEDARAKRSNTEQEDMGQMVVTMQETFAGIRVVKSFAREDHQEKSFQHSNWLQFVNMMRIVRSTEMTGPLVETIAAARRWPGAPLRLFRRIFRPHVLSL